MLFSDNFSKNITNLYLFYYLTSSNNNILAFPVIITIAFSFFYDFYLVILILAGLIPNNKIDSFLRLAFSLSLSLSLSLSVCVCLSVCLFLSLSTVADDCHCSTLRERDFPRYPLPTILLHTTSATSSRLSSSFLSRLLTAVCQPSTLPYFSRVRSGATARAAGGGSGGG